MRVRAVGVNPGVGITHESIQTDYYKWGRTACGQLWVMRGNPYFNDENYGQKYDLNEVEETEDRADCPLCLAVSDEVLREDRKWWRRNQGL